MAFIPNGPKIRSFSQAVLNLDYAGELNSGRSNGSNLTSTRLYSLGLVVPSLVAGVADASLTLVGTAAAIVTLGTQPKINGLVYDLGIGSKRMLREPYAHLIRSLNLNPNALPPTLRIPKYELSARSIESIYRPKPSASWMKRHVESRFNFILNLVFLVAMLIFHLVKFLFAFVFSLLALRKSERLNQWTFEALIFPSVIHDICILAISFVNPQAKFDNHTVADKVFKNLAPHGPV